MLALFVILAIGLFFVIGAVRILVGWFGPSGAVATFDAMFLGFAKLVVVIIGLVIIAAIVFGLA